MFSGMVGYPGGIFFSDFQYNFYITNCQCFFVLFITTGYILVPVILLFRYTRVPLYSHFRSFLLEEGFLFPVSALSFFGGSLSPVSAFSFFGDSLSPL